MVDDTLIALAQDVHLTDPTPQTQILITLIETEDHPAVRIRNPYLLWRYTPPPILTMPTGYWTPVQVTITQVIPISSWTLKASTFKLPRQMGMLQLPNSVL